MASVTTIQLSREELNKLPLTNEARITDVKHLSSYNWIENPTPTIAIPGCPALWSPSNSERKLKPDSGRVFIAQNAARHPSSPVEPLFRAIYTTNPSFDLSNVDIVSDRNNLRKLYAFVNPSNQKFGREPFSIQVEVIGDTAILCRSDEAVKQFIKPGQFCGYGHEFEKKYTKQQLQKSTGHHRIVSYQFCGMQLVIRHETDGYVDDATDTTNLNDGRNALADVMDKLSLTSNDTRHPGSKLTIQQKGQIVPLESTLEIKTRTSRRSIRVAEVALQLWISQTPKLVRAYHTDGLFPKPHVEDMVSAIKNWETTQQKDLKKLGAVLKWSITAAKQCGGKAWIKYDDESDTLAVSRSSAPNMFPSDLYAKWERAKQNQSKDDEDDKTE